MPRYNLIDTLSLGNIFEWLSESCKQNPRWNGVLLVIHKKKKNVNKLFSLCFVLNQKVLFKQIIINIYLNEWKLLFQLNCIHRDSFMQSTYRRFGYLKTYEFVLIQLEIMHSVPFRKLLFPKSTTINLKKFFWN